MKYDWEVKVCYISSEYIFTSITNYCGKLNIQVHAFALNKKKSYCTIQVSSNSNDNYNKYNSSWELKKKKHFHINFQH